MTINLPEPTAFSIFDYEGSEALYLMENNEDLYKCYQKQDAKALDNLYTESQLKQAMRDVLEEAAQICERAKSLYTQGTMYSPVPGLFQIRADEIRKLLEQVK